MSIRMWTQLMDLIHPLLKNKRYKRITDWNEVHNVKNHLRLVTNKESKWLLIVWSSQSIGLSKTSKTPCILYISVSISYVYFVWFEYIISIHALLTGWLGFFCIQTQKTVHGIYNRRWSTTLLVNHTKQKKQNEENNARRCW